MDKPVLPRRQQELYDFVKDYIQSKGESPSYIEISRSLNMTVAQVGATLAVLRCKGYIDKNPEKKNRSLIIAQ